ncbi:MAG: hypothetical protein ACOX6S_15080 [Clostridia bacterium]|jgi:LysM repeat protein
MGQETFGVLVGEKRQEEGSIRVYIESAIPIGKLKRISTQPASAGKWWNKVEKRMSQLYFGKEIMGWYGIRTGWEAMLTEEDRSIHRELFPKSHQVIFLLDDASGAQKFYHWQRNHIKTYKGAVLWEGEEGKKLQPIPPIRWRRGFSLMAVAVISFVLGFLYRGSLVPPDQVLQQDSASKPFSQGSTENAKILAQKDAEIQQLKGTIKDLEEELERIGHEKEELERKNRGLAMELDGKLDDAIQENQVLPYRIEKGDALSRISRKFYGDSSMAQALGRFNRIPEGESLEIGSYILIPPKEWLDP